MGDQADLILLIFAVTFVNTRGRRDSITFLHQCLKQLVVESPHGFEAVLSDKGQPVTNTINLNHHSPSRHLIDLKIEHADIDAMVDAAVLAAPLDEILLRRLKKRRLQLRDQISQLEVSLDPREPA